MKTLACIVVLMLMELLISSSSGEAQNTSPAFKTLYSFSRSDDGAGEEPLGNLAIGAGGVLYGTTYEGGASDCGNVFSLTPPAASGGAWPYAVLYNFTHAATDGCGPVGGVAIGSGGVLYGSTAAGGAGNDGAVYSLTPPASPGGSWTFALLYGGFGPGTLVNPTGSLAIGSGGVLYGVTAGAGAPINSPGGTFSVTPPASSGGPWIGAVLYSFPENVIPTGVVIGAGGVLYGTTFSDSGGGGCPCGTVFSLTPPASPGGPWVETTLHTFAGAPADGAYPSLVALGSGGVLYGATQYGGSAPGPCPFGDAGCGTVFSLTPPVSPGGTWTEAVLYNFAGAPGDGATPLGGVALARSGVLYGTTESGGTGTNNQCVSGCGTVFSLTPPASPGGAWAETVLFNLGGRSGTQANTTPAIGSTGMLFGTTYNAAAREDGSVFSLRP